MKKKLNFTSKMVDKDQKRKISRQSETPLASKSFKKHPAHHNWFLHAFYSNITHHISCCFLQQIIFHLNICLPFHILVDLCLIFVVENYFMCFASEEWKGQESCCPHSYWMVCYYFPKFVIFYYLRIISQRVC